MSRTLSGGDDDERVAIGETGKNVQAAAHRVDGGRHRLAGEHLPSGEDLGPLGSEERMHVAGQLLGFLRPGRHREHRQPEVPDEGREQERAGGFRDGHRRARAQKRLQALFGQQVQERRQ